MKGRNLLRSALAAGLTAPALAGRADGRDDRDRLTRPGQPPGVPRWFFAAARAAAESSDDHLHAGVLARKAMVPLNYGGGTTIGNATTLRASGFATTKQLG
ncbi:hypothetical protein ACIRG4_17695 [Streptomyces sp. NPDC102395]|uniref:hypothetical protein n=1 Tax=Streptomyces sp. NPDC102395 TaxID=3366168 RepID=UPI003814B347